MELSEIERRYIICTQSSMDRLNRSNLVRKAIYEYEKHLTAGEDFDQAYRFPELFGIAQRKYNNIVQILPECKLRGQNDCAIAMQAAYNTIVNESNIDRVKKWAIKSAIYDGSGWMLVLPRRITRDVNNKEVLLYDGITAEWIDSRDIFPAYSAIQLHDHTTLHRCPYLFRRRVFYKDSFKALYDKPEYNIEGFKVTTYNSDFFGGIAKLITDREAVEKTLGYEYVQVLEYWDIENNIFEILCTGREEPVYKTTIYGYEDGLNLSHKQLPFHAYWNFKREDSINGVSEVELNYPYSIFREEVLNLMIENEKLNLQPIHFVSGDIDINPERNEIQAGALISVNGLRNGKIGDSIVPYNPSGNVTRSPEPLLSLLENSRIVVTADDTTALYSNPNQLATQTLAKKETLNKMLDANIYDNTLDSEFYLAGQIASYIKNELAEPYKNEKGKVQYRKVWINGFTVRQEKDTSEIELERNQGAVTSFLLNSEVSKQFSDVKVEIVPVQKDEELKRDQTEKQMTFMNTVLSTLSQLAQVNPALLDIFKDMDISEYIKETAKNLGVEVKNIFPSLARKDVEIDKIDYEHTQILAGITPPIRLDEDSLQESMKHQEWHKSAFYQESKTKKSEKAFNEHIKLTYENAYKQLQKPVEDRQREMESIEEARQQSPISRASQLPPTANQPMQGQLSPQMAGQGMGQGIPSGANINAPISG